jgi:hypothetical protein
VITGVPPPGQAPTIRQVSETEQSTAAAGIGDDATAEVRAQARHELRGLAVVAPTFLVGAALLRLEPGSWSAEEWIMAAASGATAVVVTWGLLGTERGRRLQSRRLLARYAVRHHLDPGLGRRQAADREARQMARQWLAGSLLLIVFVPQFAFASWDDPGTAVPGAILVAVAGALSLGEILGHTRAGRRWLADPPGPPRD